MQKKEYFREDGKINMCKGLTDMLQDEKAEGRAEGRVEGKAEGKAEAVMELLADMGNVPEDIRSMVNSENNTEKLHVMLKAAAKSETFDDFRERIG